MKKLTLILAGLVATAFQSNAHGYSYINSYADAFVFDEMGITFSVYPDGEFDFYLANSEQHTTVSNGFVNVTFNSGYNYSPYVQYDDFGAVIQVENVPIWYDHYGRVNQIGDVLISYRNQRVARVGGLIVHYNSFGHYAYHTGYINVWNPYFVYRPFYVAFARPAVHMCFVRPIPYRQYYTPVRYTYYRPYVQNVRPSYATIGHTYRPSGHGQVHHRYTQTAGRGEMPVTRARNTVTTESVRQAALNNRSATSNRNDAQPAQMNRNATQSSPRAVVNPDSRQAPNTLRQTTPQRQTVDTQPRMARPAPSQTTTPQRNTTTQPRNTETRTVQPRPAETRTVQPRTVQPQTTQRQPVQSRPTTTGPVQRPSAIEQKGPAPRSTAPAVKPQSAPRNTVAPRPQSSTPQRVSTPAPARTTPATVKTPSRISAPSGPVNKGDGSRRGN